MNNDHLGATRLFLALIVLSRKTLPHFSNQDFFDLTDGGGESGRPAMMAFVIHQSRCAAEHRLRDGVQAEFGLKSLELIELVDISRECARLQDEGFVAKEATKGFVRVDDNYLWVNRTESNVRDALEFALDFFDVGPPEN